ncbi:alkanesulfonate monooxygenase SsuD/methylene tetrahydromethanopterin reductase-like flavin-dependent oxidoreductase (luciferase family) [Nakamurella sp. UYEF19]|uniref:LLM class flavin-dependent oxidoreductase n=1 Tax=Nakamurella sp. UYEF19 TaxID=1756392 RepID=UPI0033962BF2
MKISVLIPFMPTRSEQVVPLAAFVQHGPAHALWQGQALLLDPYLTFAHLAALGLRVPVGLGVALMPFRHPYDAALSVRSLALTTGSPVVAGFGPGAPRLQQAMLGSAYRRPLQASREYLTVVAGLLREGHADVSGEYLTNRLQSAGPPAPGVEIGLGVLRPGMARLAGELADVAITWMTPVTYLEAEVLPALQAGARASGHPTPRVTAVIPIALARPDRDPAALLLAGSSGHLSMPHYQDMLARSGVAVDPEDLPATARSAVRHDVFLYGDEDALPAKVAAFEAAGVDEIVLNVTGLCQTAGPTAALSELQAIVGVLTRQQARVPA